jgi:hypothetical protein
MSQQPKTTSDAENNPGSNKTIDDEEEDDCLISSLHTQSFVIKLEVAQDEDDTINQLVSTGISS